MTSALSAARQPARSYRGRWYVRHLPYFVLLVTGAAALITLALLHHQAFGTGYDLGIYDQVVWNLAHGRWFETSLVYETGGFYDHFEPFLALIAPLYWLFSDVRVLLVLQALALALGSLPIYLFARQYLQGYLPSLRWATGFALLFAAAYLVYPALYNANLNDFHEVALTPPLIGFALFGLLTGRRRLTFVFLALCLLVKEDLAVTVLSFGLYILVFRPKGFRRRHGVIVVLLSVLWTLLILQVFYPAITRGLPFPFVSRRYSGIGDSPTSALRSLLTQPQQILAQLGQVSKLRFILQLSAPLLFLPLLGWPVISLALPILFYLMLSSNEQLWSMLSYHNPPLLPFLFFALIVAWGYLSTWFRRRDRSPVAVLSVLGLALLLSSGLGYREFALSPGGRDADLNAFRLTPTALAARDLLAQVPPDAAVSAEWRFIPYLSHRQRIYTLLARPQQPPAYLLEKLDPNAVGAPLYPYAAPDGFPPVYNEYTPITTVASFQILAYQRSITLTSLPEPEAPLTPLTLAAYGWLGSDDPSQAPVLSPGGETSIVLAWHRTTDAPLTQRYVFFLHLLDPDHVDSDGAPLRIAQSDQEAGQGRFPTTEWVTWTRPPVVLDVHTLAIPPSTPPGVYELWAGAYEHDSQDRLEIGGPGQTLVHIGSVTVR